MKGKIYLYSSYFQIFRLISVSIVFKNHYLYSSINLKGLLKIKWIFYFANPFVTRNFRGTCSSLEMLQGYICQRKFGKPWSIASHNPEIVYNF